MVSRKVLSTLSVVSLLVLAGCGAPFGTNTTPGPTPDATDTESSATSTTPLGAQSPSPTESGDEPRGSSGIGESERVTVSGGDLPFNATVAFRRTERLFGVDAPAPEVVVEGREPVDFSALEPRPYQVALGLEVGSGSISDCDTFYPATGGDRVSLTPGTFGPEALELVFVHELGHSLQSQALASVDLVERATFVGNMGGGAAVYVTDQYADRYDKRWNGLRPIQMRKCLYDHAPGTYRQSAGEVYFGARYIEARIDSPTNLSTVFRTPPRSEEQIVHRLAPDAEPVRDLDVTANARSRWELAEQRRAGEIELRAWLRAGLATERVDTAATGWGADQLLRFGTDDRPGVVWVLRMDSEDDADELAAALEDLERDLEQRNATSVRSIRVGHETVVAVAGPQSFVANTTATGTAGNVTVATP